MFRHQIKVPVVEYRGMDLPLRELPQIGREIGVWAVRRRHVIYVAGYEPRGARGYYRLLERECDRFQRVWPVSLTVKPVDLDSRDFARWLVAVRASNWRVFTTYDFLRFDNFIRSDLAQPLPPPSQKRSNAATN